MDRVYAFTDEYGQFGWDINKQDVSSCFIISAIIVKESDLGDYTKQAEAIRKKYFQTGEIKSSKVANNSGRRKRILSDLSKLPFLISSVVINKQDCLDNMNSKGLQYKQSFYKFMNNIVHKELRHAFDTLTIVADELGSNDYMESFCKYVAKNQDPANLFGEAKFMFERSHQDVRIQVADFISGTLGRIYDNNKTDNQINDYFQIIKDKIIRIEKYPKTYNDFSVDDSAMASEYDKDIAKLCFSRAVTYLKNYDLPANSNEEFEKARIIVLKYLLFKFMNNDGRKYIPTKELSDQLQHTNLHRINDQAFRSNIIGKLRDRDVIIASSTKGYKIPSRLSEIKDYVTHDAKVVMPMLSRLNKCRKLVKMNTLNEIDLLDKTGFEKLKSFFDNYPEDVSNE